MVDWEHEPTSGPVVYLGGGVLGAVGGVSLLWIAAASSAGWGVVALGAAVLVAGSCSAVLAARRLLRERRSARDGS